MTSQKTSKRIEWSALVKREDWWANWLAAVAITLASLGVVNIIPKLAKWNDGATLGAQPWWGLLAVGVSVMALTAIAIRLISGKLKSYVYGIPIVFALSILAFVIAQFAPISKWGLEYVLWALLLGLLISNTIGTPAWLRPALKTELFIKIGLVLLGASILFQIIIKTAPLAILMATVGIIAEWFFAFWLARRLKLNEPFAAVLATAGSVCGVSAAIAAGGATKSKQTEVSYTISLVLLISIPLIIILPIIARMIAIPPVVAGAWFGGVIDTTAAVAAAGAAYGDAALKIASIVKIAQNALIGVVAFLLAIYFAFKNKKIGEKPKAMDIWYGFPKFIIGFVLASVVFSLLLTPILGNQTVDNIVKNVTEPLRGWFFAMAFVSIGLETRLADILKLERGRPLIVYASAVAFDIVFTLGLAYLIWGRVSV